jgi:hypothetical protein
MVIVFLLIDGEYDDGDKPMQSVVHAFADFLIFICLPRRTPHRCGHLLAAPQYPLASWQR